MGAAADLRVTLDQLLGQHAILAAQATSAALDGDAAADEYKAAGASLEANTVALGGAIKSVYGADAEKTFLTLWRNHIGFFVDYTVGTATKDDAKKQKAAADLAGYGRDFAAFISGANPNLPAKAVEDLLTTHIAGLAKGIDDYAAKDYKGAYTQMVAAYDHMFMIGDALAGGIAAQFPDKFPAGSATTSAVDLRIALDRLLGEHAVLAAMATQKGLGGDATKPQFTAAADLLEANTVDLGAAIKSVYGADAEKTFLTLWRNHIGFFVDYTVGTATKDEAKKKAAGDALAGYARDFGAFIGGANPNLPAAAVEGLLKPHITQLATNVDAYYAKDFAKSYMLQSEAYAHMYMTGDALAGGIVAQFPDKFGK